MDLAKTVTGTLGLLLGLLVYKFLVYCAEDRYFFHGNKANASEDMSPKTVTAPVSEPASDHPGNAQSKPALEIPQYEIAETIISDHSKELARISLTFSEYKDQDEQQDPIESLHDAEILLHEARRVNRLMADPTLRHRLAQRLEWVLRNPADPKTIATAELLVAYNQDRCKKSERYKNDY